MTIQGNLGGDPKQVKTEAATFIVLSIAQSYKSKDEEKTEWFEVSVFEPSLMEKCSGLKKGDLVHTAGHIKPIKKKIDTKTFPVLKLVANQVHKIAKITPIMHDSIPTFNSSEEVLI
jgi:single-stranded DNA-binding protein